MKFPTHWPVGCPPTAAVEANAVIYRVTKTNPATARDFQSQAELGRQRSANQCLRVGISVFGSFRDVSHCQRVFPKLGRFIAQAALKPRHGKMQTTPSQMFPAHMTWWPYENVNRSEPFSVITSVEEEQH